jgi:hypothetical protein
MEKLGFSARWIRLTMACVRFVSYSVVVNGNLVGKILPTRGIRQGDPISPYLFLLCAESLSSLLQHAENIGVIFGVPTSVKGPKLSHLFFTDNNLIFCKANSVEWRRLLKILGIYEAGSGHRLYMHKTSLFFSRNTNPAKKLEILTASGFSEACKLKPIWDYPP